MTLRRAVPLLALLMLPFPAAQAAAPATLACTNGYHVNWRAESPALSDSGDSDADEPGSVTIHLDPLSGKWFLSSAGSAALTQDGGSFDIVRSSAFERYHEEWVGVDHDTMLRIFGGGATMRFVFVSNDRGIIGGTCREPETTFLLLGSRTPAP